MKQERGFDKKVIKRTKYPLKHTKLKNKFV